MPDRRLAPVGPMLVAQTRAQLLQLLRSPIYSMFSLALPIIFWLFFGLPNAHQVIGGVSGGAYLLASFGAYAVANVMLFTFGINIAVERGRKQDLLMRAEIRSAVEPAVAEALGKLEKRDRLILRLFLVSGMPTAMVMTTAG